MPNRNAVAPEVREGDAVWIARKAPAIASYEGASHPEIVAALPLLRQEVAHARRLAHLSRAVVAVADAFAWGVHHAPDCWNTARDTPCDCGRDALVAALTELLRDPMESDNA